MRIQWELERIKRAPKESVGREIFLFFSFSASERACHPERRRREGSAFERAQADPSLRARTARSAQDDNARVVSRREERMNASAKAAALIAYNDVSGARQPHAS